MQARSVYKLRVGVLVACGKLQRAFNAYYANSGLRNQVLFTTTAQPAVLMLLLLLPFFPWQSISKQLVSQR